MRRPTSARTGLGAGLVLIGILGTAGCGATRHRLDALQPWEWATRAAEHPVSSIPVDVPESIKHPPQEMLPDALKEKVTLRSEAIDIRSLLLGLAKQTGLNITLDPDVTGQVSAYFNDVTVIDVLRNIADQLGAEVEVKNDVVSVHRPRNEYRMYRLHYLRNPRVGMTNFAIQDRATTDTGTASHVPVAASIALTGSQSPGHISIPMAPMGGGSMVQLVSTFGSNFWEDLDSELESIVFDGVSPKDLVGKDNFYAGIAISDQAGRSLVVDSMSGTIMVHARRSVLDAIGEYLDAVNMTIQRQVVIDVQILEVSFSDQTVFGVESSNAPFLPSSIIGTLTGMFNQNGYTGPTYNAAGKITDQSLPANAVGASITTPLGFPNVAGAINGNIATGAQLPLTPTQPVYTVNLFNNYSFDPNNKFPFQLMMQMLGQLGDVKYISAPRLTALHNQKAVLKVVRDRVFFNVLAGIVTPGTATTPEIIGPPTITPIVVPEGVTLDVTPLIGDDGSVTMEIHPSFSVIIDEKPEPGGEGSQPEVERREFDTTVRVEGSRTVVIGGLVADRSVRSETGLPYLKDIPYLGALFRDTSDLTEKSEVIVLLTPRVQDATLVKEEVNEFRALQGQDPMPDSGSSKSP